MSTITGIDLLLSFPVLVLSSGALLILMLEVLDSEKSWPRAELAAFFPLCSLLFCVVYATEYHTGQVIYNGVMYADCFSVFFSALISFGALIVLLLGKGAVGGEGVESASEYYALMLIASAGAVVFASAAELIVLFVGLELMSIALYVLCGSALGIRASSESALKYFLLGSFSSAFLLYGIALLYGLTGTTDIAEIYGFISAHPVEPLLYFAIAFLLIGFGFKAGAVPFHFWAPDVYQGAPTSVTGYMACVIKAAAFAAMLRVMWGLFNYPGLFVMWSDAVWVIAVLTMTVGNLAALRQRSIKRMLAYSSIAHAGYMLMAFLAPRDGGGSAIAFYLCAYMVMTLGAFGVVMAVTTRYSHEKNPDDISRFNGLGFSEPALGVLMTLFMFSLAGLPPGMAGLLGKFYLFNAAVKSGYIGIAIIGVINSAISCFYYLRVLVAMYFTEGSQQLQRLSVGASMAGALSICAAVTLMLGFYPFTVKALANAIF